MELAFSSYVLFVSYYKLFFFFFNRLNCASFFGRPWRGEVYGTEIEIQMLEDERIETRATLKPVHLVLEMGVGGEGLGQDS